jgi:predicted transcriptional regulator
MKKRVLLSIHPKYANAIFDGHKGYEFRRVLFKRNVNEVVVYATSPVSQVVGRFSIADIYVDSPGHIWTKTKALAGVTRDMFDTYFQDCTQAFAIKVSNPIRFAQPQPLSRYLASNTPPQSFCYI